jgi:hypothetical protein
MSIGTEENLSQDTWCAGRNSIAASPEYDSKVLPLPYPNESNPHPFKLFLSNLILSSHLCIGLTNRKLHVSYQDFTCSSLLSHECNMSRLCQGHRFQLINFLPVLLPISYVPIFSSVSVPKHPQSMFFN